MDRALRQAQPEACLHLAWYAEPGAYLHATAENLAALQWSLGLLRGLADVGCRQVVMAGTCAEYDTNQGWLREDGPTRPETIYAAAKLSLALLGQQIAAAAAMRFTWARLFYLYGPHEDQRRMVPALLRTLMSGQTFAASAGDQVRDYLHVADAAAALALLVARGEAGIYNVASGQPVTVRHLMETAQTAVGAANLVQFGALPPRPWDPPFICGDSRKLRALGWVPRYDLATGLAHTVRWQQALGSV
jgi:nucleoside-diphosphate-sugar epimerase